MKLWKNDKDFQNVVSDLFQNSEISIFIMTMNYYLWSANNK